MRRPAAVAILLLVAVVIAPHDRAAAQSGAASPDSGTSVVMRCQECGIVQTIREIQEPRRVAGPTAAEGTPVGLVMYVPFGKGPGKKDPYVGSVGTREWQDRTIDTRYEVTVRMDDGSYRLMKTQDASEFTTGDRVNVSQGRIERWNP